MAGAEKHAVGTDGAQAATELAVTLLLEAGAVLASSLDVETTMTQIARLTVPKLADLCVVDLLESDGAIRKVATAAREPRIGTELERLRARTPVDRNSDHPVARVIAGSGPLLLEYMTSEALAGFAQSSEHAEFMIESGYSSAVVAPLLARGRTLGALSLLRLGEAEPFSDDELALGSELARRAALAIDNASLYSNLRAVEQRLEAILSNLAEAITVEDAEGRIIFANRAAAELLGTASTAEITAAEPGTIITRFTMHDEQGRELCLADMPGRRLFAGEHPEPLLVRNVVRETGEERWLIVRSSPIDHPRGGGVEYAVNVFENVTGVKRAQMAESFMSEVSRVLASSMDHALTLARIARLSVPILADWCAIDIITEEGTIERVTAHHPDPAKLELVERLGRERSQSSEGMDGVSKVIRTGRPELITAITGETLTRVARSPEHHDVLREIGVSSVIIVPLAAPSRTVGAMTLLSSESGRRFTEEDVALAVRMGRRSGTAIESARLYTERDRIAHVLEQALLPDSLPEIPGIELAGLYRAAGELNDVGGDFYDAFALDDGRWVLAIGDVCGKGPHAAGVTALARHTLRTAAMLGQPPSGMLATLHRALRGQPVGADMCTVCLVTLEPGAQSTQLTVSLAGHPPPFLFGPGGERREVGTPGTVLGVFDSVRIEEVSAQLAAGETLLLYTDGLIEAGLPGQRSEESALFETARAAGSKSVHELLEALAEAASNQERERRRDDIALVAVRMRSP